MKNISWINTRNRTQNNRRRLDQIMLRDSKTGLYSEESFNEFLSLEKKRRERTESPVFLMLADLSAITDISERQKIAKTIMDLLSDITRDTDIKGWHVDGLVIGIMFTEMAIEEATSQFALKRVANKCLGCLGSHLDVESFSRIQISWQSVHNGHILDIHKVAKG